MSKFLDIACAKCNKPFQRLLKEHRRSIKLGRKEFCSRSCGAEINNCGPIENRLHPENLIAGNRKDEFTGFRYYIRKAMERTPGSNISLQDIKDQWEKQEGKCAYTRMTLTLKEEVWSKAKEQKLKTKMYYMASLDRIDSSRPYEKGNIQFVSLPINFMKSTMSDADTRALITLIKQP